MNMKQRLIKLEKATPAAVDDIHIAKFFVDPGGIEPIGYQSDSGEEIFREPGESDEALKNRSKEVVYWPIGKNSRHIFEPIY